MQNARNSQIRKPIVVEPTEKGNPGENRSRPLKAPQHNNSAFSPTIVSGKGVRIANAIIDTRKVSNMSPDDSASPTSVIQANEEQFSTNSSISQTPDKNKVTTSIDTQTKANDGSQNNSNILGSKIEKPSIDPHSAPKGLSATQQEGSNRTPSRLDAENPSGIGLSTSVGPLKAGANGKEVIDGKSEAANEPEQLLVVQSSSEAPVDPVQFAGSDRSTDVIETRTSQTNADQAATENATDLSSTDQSSQSSQKYELNVRAKPFKPKAAATEFVPPENKSFSHWFYGSEAEVEAQRRRQIEPQYLPPYHVLDIVGSRGMFLMPGHVPVESLAAMGLVILLPWMTPHRYFR